MKKLTKISIFIAILIITISAFSLINMAIKYNKLAQNIELNYFENGKSLSDIIKIAVKNNQEVMSSFQDYIYKEMLNDIEEHKKPLIILNSPILVYDTLTEGFYFSQKLRNDSFKIIVYKGNKIFQIAREKMKYRNIERLSGAGKYIQKIGKLSSIEYIVVQDVNGIISATDNVDSISSLFIDTLAMIALIEKQDILRKHNNVYEFLTPYYFNNSLLRIGFNSEPIDSAKNQSRFLFLISIIVITTFMIFTIFIIIYYSKNIILANKLLIKEREIADYFQLISDGILVIDNNNNVITYNASFEQMFNIKNKNDIKKLLVQEEFANILKDKIDNGIEYQYGNRYFLISKKMIEYNMKKIITIKDLTEIELLKNQNKLKEKQALLGELSFKVAHELKNPLNGISIVLQRILHFDNIANEEKILLKDALKEVDRMNNRIIEFTKFAKPIDYKFEIIDIEDIIENVLSQLKIHIQNKKIKIDKNLFNCKIRADKEHMIIAVKNIILNSIEAIEKNGVIKIYNTLEKQKCTLKIIDNGKGIDKEIFDKIFNLYFTTKKSGSGIGLASAYRIIKDIDGEIEIESEIGKGTKITIVLNRYEE